MVAVDARSPHDCHEERRGPEGEGQSPVVAVSVPSDENLLLLPGRNVSRPVDCLPPLHPHCSRPQHQTGVVPHSDPHAGGVRSPRTRYLRCQHGNMANRLVYSVLTSANVSCLPITAVVRSEVGSVIWSDDGYCQHWTVITVVTPQSSHWQGGHWEIVWLCYYDLPIASKIQTETSLNLGLLELNIPSAGLENDKNKAQPVSLQHTLEHGRESITLTYV